MLRYDKRCTGPTLHSETRSEPVLVIPLTSAKGGFDPSSPWTSAWADPSLQQRLVPMVVSKDDAANLAIASNLAHLDWIALAPITHRYKAGQVILAIASDDAMTVQMIAISPTVRTASSSAFAQSTFALDPEAVAEKAAHEWNLSLERLRLANELKPKPIIDDGPRRSRPMSASKHWRIGQSFEPGWARSR